MKLLLAALGLVLGALLTFQWIGWDPRPPLQAAVNDPAAPAASVPPALPNAADLLTPPPPQQEYAAVIERPLFLPDRRPPPAGADSASETLQTQRETADDSILQGLDFNAVLIDAANEIAWVRLPREPKPRRLRPGDDIDGWTLTELHPDSLVLRNQGEKRRFMLRDYANAPRAARPAPTAGPQDRGRSEAAPPELKVEPPEPRPRMLGQ